jgi:N-acetylmuramoyl-L-alanine amidase
MSQTHTVQPGEHLSGIAAQYGFLNFRTIYDDTANAALRQKRPNPEVLLPGDEIIIPDRVATPVGVASGKSHAFVIASESLLLNVRVQRLGGAPLAQRATVASMGERSAGGGAALDPPQQGETDATGNVAIVVSSTTVEGDLQLAAKPPDDPEERHFRLLVGGLNPAVDGDTGKPPVDPASGAPDLSGVRARLTNLGYFAGYTERDEAQLRWALEEFQCEHKASHGLKVTGTPDTKTLKALCSVHGDAAAS